MRDLERYRSGHNEAVLKTVCLHGHMGSNPILSVGSALAILPRINRESFDRGEVPKLAEGAPLERE